MLKPSQQRMFLLYQLKKFKVSKSILTQIYRAIIDSVSTFSITVWYGSASLHNKNMPEGIVKAASSIIGCDLPSIESIYATSILCKATTIISDSSIPQTTFLNFFPLGSGGSDLSEPEPPALVTGSTRKQSKPCHFTQSQKNKNNKSFLPQAHVPFKSIITIAHI